MPSTTRGSILISTANDIGEALVEKLGGVGYSPNEWKEKYNLCGIAPVDSAPALSVLADSAGTGDERGSILIATADAIGAILNKKYNVLRGFKPKEWASACRKMKALEEGSVASASIASFSDGADDVPTKSLVVTIPPTLSGVSSVTETQTGNNLFDISTATNGQINGTNGVYYANANWQASDFFPVHGANLTLSWDTDSSNYYQVNLAFYDSEEHYVDGSNNTFANIYSNTFTIPNGAVYCRASWSISVGGSPAPRNNIRINLGSTDRGYTPYTSPTQYTASLGRTIYGGQADIVSGEGKETCSFPTLLSSLAWSKTTISGHDAFYANLPDGYMGQGSGGLDGDCDTYAITTDANLGTDKTIRFYYNANFNISRCVIRDDQYASLTGAQFKETVSGNIVYLLAESARTDFTFTGQEINTRLGYNAFWSDSGDTAVEYYQAPTPYARKTATGGIANFSDQRTDLPLTKAIANIAPSIAGKSAVNLYQGKKNIYPAIMTQDGANRVILYDNIYLPMGNYYLSLVNNDGLANFYIKTHASTTWSNVGGYNKIAIPITISDNDYYDISYYISTGINAESLSNVQIEVGSSQSAFEPYQDPTTYTAELGETVYGGNVDFVSGEVVNDCAKDSMSSSYLSGLSLGTYIGYEAQTAYFNYHPSIWVRNWNYQTAAARTAGGIKCACDEFPASMNNTTIFAAQYRIYFDVNGKNISSVQDFIDYVTNLEQNGKQLEITYELATPTESTIPGRVISPIEGVNNYWNDAGGDTEIQYFEDET